MAPTNAVWIDRPHGPAVLKSSRFSEHPAFSYNENKDRIDHGEASASRTIASQN
jgi:hypothetical protein